MEKEERTTTLRAKLWVGNLRRNKICAVVCISQQAPFHESILRGHPLVPLLLHSASKQEGEHTQRKVAWEERSIDTDIQCGRAESTLQTKRGNH